MNAIDSNSTINKFIEKMADKPETVICGAAGDSCIGKIAKPLCADDIACAKNETPEITSITEVVVGSNATPLNDNKISPTTVVEESGDVIKMPLETVTPIIQPVVPEVIPVSTADNGAQDALLTNLQKEMEVQKRTSERDDYEKKLADAEKKLAALEASYEAATSGKDNETSLRREMEELKRNLAHNQAKFNDRGRLMANQENQINALTKQVSSLKEVVAITKNLLEIRNMEVKHLQGDVDSMENRITAERDRHNAMLRKMDAAVRLNADLKTEYETQLRLFQDLRGKYEEKVTLLTAENKAACGAAVAEPPATQPPASIQ